MNVTCDLHYLPFVVYSRYIFDFEVEQAEELGKWVVYIIMSLWLRIKETTTNPEGQLGFSNV